MANELKSVITELELGGTLFNVLEEVLILFPEEKEKILEMAKYYESLEKRIEEKFSEEGEE